MDFVFVDETGDPGSSVASGASAYFGLALLCVRRDTYEAIRRLLSQIHWLSGTVAAINLGPNPVRALLLLRGLRELVNKGFASASGLFIHKTDYGGRYLEWSDVDTPKSEWPYYLRNYLLRHLLEFHFQRVAEPSESIDLVLDRVMLTESQRQNTLRYLCSETPVPLKQPFSIPKIEHLTIADSDYVGGLEIAHLLAYVLREQAKGTIAQEVASLADFLRIEHFVGHKAGEQN